MRVLTPDEYEILCKLEEDNSPGPMTSEEYDNYKWLDDAEVDLLEKMKVRGIVRDDHYENRDEEYVWEWTEWNVTDLGLLAMQCYQAVTRVVA